MIQLLLLSCSIITKESNFAHIDIAVASASEAESKIDYKYYNVLDIAPAKIIVPKNQTVAQGLSVLVNDGCGNLIVFDGGRVEDADYLCDIIKDNGGVVKTWFITHIHDDHIGALYKILNDKRTDIIIEELVYDFADFNWYYEKMGDDAGIYYLFENAIKEYNEYAELLNIRKIHIDNYKNKFFKYISSDEIYGTVPATMKVEVLNEVYELDQDPINNTSIVYYVGLGDRTYNCKEIGILIFGDLGYEGGNRLFKDHFNDYKYFNNICNIDVLVLAHHGQNGIDPKFYKRFNPKVVIWPTSKDIYENIKGTYKTDETKKVLSEMDSIKYQIKSYEETAVIR